ncbi:MAG: hypothetical protein WAW11_04350 [Patescibacteria group bacterium]
MKKLFLLVFLPFVLTGCSLIGNQASENKPSEAPVNKEQTGQAEQKVAPVLPEALSIASLKAGDQVEGFTVKAVGGNLCEKDCTTDICGKIEFDGEYILSGHLIFNPTAFTPLLFAIDSKVPNLAYFVKTKSATLNVSDKSVIAINDANFNKGDFSVINKALPDFSSFITNSKKATTSTLYSKRLQIKVKNFTTELCVTDKNKINSAEFISLELGRSCVASAFKFQYPSSWGKCQVKDNKVLTFKTDYDKYQVDLILTMNSATKEKYSEAKKTAINLTHLNNGEFFEEAQGGAMMGGMMLLGGNYYDYIFDIKSDQPAPENLDGVWVPENNITKDVMLNILSSVEKVK